MPKIIQLNDREHVLKRPARYIGSVVPVEQERFYLENEKIKFGTISYVPAFIKIVREIIDNSVEHAIETNFEYSNLIKINISKDKIIIEDNGKGIPVKYIQDSKGNIIEKYAPEAVWTQLKTGSAFNDEEANKLISQNGEGSTLTNIFSKKFIGETWDGEKYFKLTCKNNMEEIKTEIKEIKGKTGTKVTFYPDLEKLHMTEINQFYQDLIKFEILYLAATYPEIDFKFNNRLIKIKSFKQLYNQYFDDHIIFAETDDVFVGFSHSEDGYKFIHFINGLNVFNGGKVLEYADNKIIGALTEKLQKRYPNIKRSDVKNKIVFHLIIKNLSLPRFADQIKSECVNILTTQDPIGSQINEIAKSKFIDKVYKDKEIIGPIIDLFKAKEMIKDKRELVKAVKNNDKPVKYWPAMKDKKYLIISEGDSAIGSIINGVGRDYCGFYPIKGKTSNVLKDSRKLKKDSELLDLAYILGIDFSGNQEQLNYENIVVASDMDTDGSHIISLIIGYFYLVAPEYLRQGKFYRFLTPLAVTYKGNKIDKMFFDYDELYAYKGSNIEYKKGLGSLTEEEWDELFKRYSFEDLLLEIKLKTENDIKILKAWLEEEREYRKKIIEENINKFNLDNI